MEVVKRDAEDSTHVYLSGHIDETVQFEASIGTTQTEIEVNCKGISRINSIGVKKWIKYFDGLRASGARLRFVECSVSFILQAALLEDFVVRSEIALIYLPFYCPSCSQNSHRLFEVESLRQCNFIPEGGNCTCGGALAFDDTEEYFNPLRD